MKRYSRQMVLDCVGKSGQEKLLKARVTIVGMGAIGSVVANNLCRAGVGFIRIVDRDYVELTNLQRQLLYTEEDALQQIPKAIAAFNHLTKINSEIVIEPLVTDVNASNIETMISDVDLVLDGSDNIDVRYLIGEACDKLKKPWIYGGAMMTSGLTMNIIPGETACFRCICPDPPPPESFVSCSTVGVLGMITGTIATIESAEAIKILTGSPQVRKTLMQVDVWYSSTEFLEVEPHPDCPVCGQHTYENLSRATGAYASSLCGMDSTQIVPAVNMRVDFEFLSNKLSKIGEVKHSKYMLSFTDGIVDFNLFTDGRAIIKNIKDENAAKSIYTEYIGL